MSDYPIFKARHVEGDFFELNKTDYNKNPLPEDKYHWYVGFAIPKGPEWDAVYSIMFNTASNDPACTTALCQQQGFNWKFEDCDAPKDPNKLGSASRPAGHMLLKMTRNVGMGQAMIVDESRTPIVDKSSIKRGDYYYVKGSTKFNDCKTVVSNAGMFQNFDKALYAGPGQLIESGSDDLSAFDGVIGASVAQAVPTAQATPAAPVAPAHDLHAPGIAPPPPVAPAAPEIKYLVDGVVHTKSALVAVGYTDGHFSTMTPVA